MALSPRLPMIAALLCSGSVLSAQWTNRYPKVKGFSHHVYLEGYELPLVTIGPVDPASSPDGRQIAIASRGWLWMLDPVTGVATRLTHAGGMDSRPAWSPDGRQLAFVRDDGRVPFFGRLSIRLGARARAGRRARRTS